MKSAYMKSDFSLYIWGLGEFHIRNLARIMDIPRDLTLHGWKKICMRQLVKDFQAVPLSMCGAQLLYLIHHNQKENGFAAHFESYGLLRLLYA